MTTPLVEFSGLSWPPNTRTRRYLYPTEGAKHGAQIWETVLGMNVREVKKSLQDDAEHGYYLDGREILTFGKEFFNLSFVRAKSSVARVQPTL